MSPNASLKKALKPCNNRRIICELGKEHPKDINNACPFLGISESSLEQQLTLIAQKNPVEGFWDRN